MVTRQHATPRFCEARYANFSQRVCHEVTVAALSQPVRPHHSPGTALLALHDAAAWLQAQLGNGANPMRTLARACARFRLTAEQALTLPSMVTW